jgi:hypothetical protein
MNCWHVLFAGALWLGLSGNPHARAGDLAKNYHTATTPGAWSHYQLSASDGSVATYRYERRADDQGRPVFSLSVETTAGVAAGSESTMTYTLPANFDFARNGLSYGKFIEKMSMQYGDTVMPVDDNTLEIIRGAEKDYRGKLTPAGVENVGDWRCDRYTYSMGPDTAKETGALWLNEEIPFAIVKHAGQILNADKTPSSSFEMILVSQGQQQLADDETAAAAAPEPIAEPAEVTLAEGFKAGWIGLDLVPLEGGRKLSVNFRNEYKAQLTIRLAPGPVELTVDFPVETLKITVLKAQNLVLAPGASSETIVVQQRGPRGIVEGKCYQSIYEGAPIFQGSVTMGNVPK